MRTIRAITELRIATDGIGHEILTIAIGETGQVSDKLAQDFIDEGSAEAVVTEQKKVTAAPENKAHKAAPSNKKDAKKKGK
jgi:hypothetical protein